MKKIIKKFIEISIVFLKIFLTFGLFTLFTLLIVNECGDLLSSFIFLMIAMFLKFFVKKDIDDKQKDYLRR
jgi:hypothetical protein